MPTARGVVQEILVAAPGDRGVRSSAPRIGRGGPLRRALAVLLLAVLGVTTAGAHGGDATFEAAIRAADDAARAGDVATAKRHYREAVGLAAGKLEETRAAIALSALVGGDSEGFDEASRLLRRTITLLENETAPDLVARRLNARNNLAAALAMQGRADEAIQVLAADVSAIGVLEPALAARYLLNHAYALENAGLEDAAAASEALAQYFAAFELDPAMDLAREGVFRLARRLRSERPDGIDFAVEMIDELSRRGDFEAAELYLRQALRDLTWLKDLDAGSKILVALVRHLVHAEVDPPTFKAHWTPLLRRFEDSPDVLRDAARQVAKIYAVRDLPLGTRKARRQFSFWYGDPKWTDVLQGLIDLVARWHYRTSQSESPELDALYLLGLNLEREGERPPDVPFHGRAGTHVASRVLRDSGLTNRYLWSEELTADVQEKIGRGLMALARHEEGPRRGDALLDGAKFLERAAVSYAREGNKRATWTYAAAFTEIEGLQLADVSLARGPELARIRDELVRLGDRLTFSVIVESAGDPPAMVAEAPRHPPRVDSDLDSDWTVRIRREEVPGMGGNLLALSEFAPTVKASFVDVAGDASGRHSLLVGAAAGHNNVYLVDGVVISDLSNPSAAPDYFGLDAVEEMQLNTSGADISMFSSGLILNMVTQTPGREWSGSARLASNDGFLQPGGSAERRDFAPGQQPVRTNEVRHIDDWGMALSFGEIDRRLRPWISYSHHDSQLLTTGGFLQDVGLASWTAKLDATLGPASYAGVSASLNDKTESGRGVGISRAPESSWNEEASNDFFRAWYNLTRVERQQYSLEVSRVEGAKSLVPQGGLEHDPVLGDNGVWRGGFRQAVFDRRADQWILRGSYVPPSYQGLLSYGARAQRANHEELNFFGPRNVAFLAGENLDTEFDVARFFRTGAAGTGVDTDVLWLQGERQFRRFGIEAGVRYVHQEGRNKRTFAPAHPLASDRLPAVEFIGGDEISWETVKPRIGLTYLLGETWLLRGVLARYDSQMHTAFFGRTNPAFIGTADFGFTDLDGDGILDEGAETASLFPLASAGLDLADPGAPTSPNLTSPGLDPELTDEIVVGLERPFANGSLALNATFRQTTDVHETRKLVRDETGRVRPAQRADYVFERSEAGTLPGGEPFTAGIYSLRPGLAFTGGSLLVNGDREQDYFSANVRLNHAYFSGKLRLRGHLAYEDWRWDLGPEFTRFDDPTSSVQMVDGGGFSRTDLDDDVVAFGVPDADEPLDSPANSTWSASLWGSYTSGDDWILGATVSGRQGYPVPYFVTAVPADGLLREVRATRATDSFRYEDLWTVDLHFEMPFVYRPQKLSVPSGAIKLNLHLEIFNLFNSDNVVQRVPQLNGPQPDFLKRTINPRVVRVGLQLSF